MADYPALDLIYRQDSSTSELLELLHACLDDFQPLAIHEHETGDGWRIFFRHPSSRDAALSALTRSFGERLSTLSPASVPDEGWARRSQAHLTAVEVGRIVVAPPWIAESIEPNPDVHVVIVQPSMGFGTGHHATTRLCLRLLQKQNIGGGRVIDVGTGSGVLAIAAWKLGANRAVAVDCDPDALQNARENIEFNQAADAIDIVNADLSTLGSDTADLVCANLTSSVLKKYAPQLQALARTGGQLIVSGFSHAELREIESAFGHAAAETLVEGDWCAARFNPIET